MLLLLLSCRGDNESPNPPTDDSVDSAHTGDSEPEPPTFCEEAGLTVRAFQGGGLGDYGDVAPDFTWETLDGPFTLSEQWSGCDVFVITAWSQRNNAPVELTAKKELVELLETSPQNTIYVFLPWEDPEDMTALKEKFEKAFGEMEPDQAAWWRGRVWFATDLVWDADWIGDLVGGYSGYSDGYPISVSIDRLQQIRENGYFCDPLTGWNTCPPFFMAYEAVYSNFVSDRQELLESHERLAVRVFDNVRAEDPGWAGARITAEVEIPDISGFDTMEIDHTEACVNHPDLANCPAWDYINELYLCERDDPETTEVDESNTCNVEVGRYITTYWRPGRWVVDATPFMALLGNGGETRKFAFYSQQPYDVTVDLLFSNQGKGERPVAMEYLYSGGYLGLTYNWGRNWNFGESQWSWYVVPDQVQTWFIQHRDDEAGVLVGKRSGDPGGDYLRLEWVVTPVEPPAAGVYICEVGRDYTSVEAALADTTTAHDHSDLATGCRGGAWTLIQGPETLSGDFVEIHHSDKLPQTFTPPEGTSRVELSAYITGHYFADTDDNCAEFCNHEHTFSVNDSGEWTYDQPYVGDTFGCAAQVEQGVIPNQAGTWVYGRGGWCPGQVVSPWRVDLTPSVDLGGENTIAYAAGVDGEIPWFPYKNGAEVGTGSNIYMTSWIVYYESME